VSRTIVGSNLITNLTVIFERAKSVEKTRWHPELGSVISIECERYVLTIGWRSFSDINRNIEDGSTPDPHQLTLSTRRALEV
jgi:hypothetical protein